MVFFDLEQRESCQWADLKMLMNDTACSFQGQEMTQDRRMRSFVAGVFQPCIS